MMPRLEARCIPINNILRLTSLQYICLRAFERLSTYKTPNAAQGPWLLRHGRTALPWTKLWSRFPVPIVVDKFAVI